MKYILTTDFLFQHSLADSISFVKSEVLDVFYDYNRHNYTVGYIEGMLFGDLNIKNFTSFSDSKITDGVFKLKGGSTVVNGVRYFTSNNVSFLQCQIFKKLEKSIVFFSGTNASISISERDLDDFNIYTYINFINENNRVKAFVEDINKFKVSNFLSLDTKKDNELNTSNIYSYEYKTIAISESYIVYSFVEHLRKKFPDFSISPDLSDLTQKKQKTNLLFYEAGLPKTGEFSIRIQEDPVFGRYIQTSIDIDFEYLSDDIETYLNVRDLMFLGKMFWLETSFLLTDETGVEWSYGVVWSVEDFSKKIERDPSTKYLSSTMLYNLKFSATIVGYLVEKIDNSIARIKYPITRFWDENKRLVSALFDYTDPNVYSKASIDLGDGNILLISYTEQGQEQKVYSLKYLNNNNEIVNLLREGAPLYDLTVEMGDEVFIDITPNNFVINPLDVPLGTFYVNPNVRAAFESSTKISLEQIKEVGKTPKIYIKEKDIKSIVPSDEWLSMLTIKNKK